MMRPRFLVDLCGGPCGGETRSTGGIAKRKSGKPTDHSNQTPKGFPANDCTAETRELPDGGRISQYCAAGVGSGEPVPADVTPIGCAYRFYVVSNRPDFAFAKG